jgi:flagellum-specific ATP synthase
MGGDPPRELAAAETPRTTSLRVPNRLERLRDGLTRLRSGGSPLRVGGRVTNIATTALEVAGLAPHVSLGDRVEIVAGNRRHVAEVIRIDPYSTSISPFDHDARIALGAAVWHLGSAHLAPCTSWKGRSINPLGAPLDGGGPLRQGRAPVALDREAPDPLKRRRITAAMPTGTRAIDIFTPLCAGQRVGIFSGSGVGKSSLLGMLARAEAFDSVVIALVGERGREVRDFLDDVLGAWRTRVVAVIATGDSSASLRRLAPKAAMSIAEHFRDQGENVLLIVDSITRFAHAAREIALAAGELPVARGFPPSVLAGLPRLLERAGPGYEDTGSITAIVSVLVDGDDMNEPIADTIRGVLDGHIVLDRRIAAEGRYPAIDILQSLSRLASRAWSPEQQSMTAKLRRLVARFEETRDLRSLGGMQAGADPELDRAIKMVPRLMEFLDQPLGSAPSVDAYADLAQVLSSEHSIDARTH